jgi:hypothetical protein
MQLITPEVSAALKQFPLGSQDGLRDNAKVLVKFFFPAGRYTFLVTEAEPRGKDVLFFGFCVSPLGEDCDEWGYTSLTELLSVRVRGLTIERDCCVPIATRTVRDLLGRAA